MATLLCHSCSNMGYTVCPCKCPTCNDKGQTPHLCSVCNNSPIRCTKCGGTGIVVCWLCEGQGHILEEGFFRKRKAQCSHCGGSGRIDCSGCRRGIATCSECKGVFTMKCRSCMGKSGDVSCERCRGSKRIRCSVCQGHGRVDLRAALSVLPAVENRFSSCGDDERMEESFGPYLMVTATQVDSALAEFLRRDAGQIWPDPRKCVVTSAGQSGPSLNIYKTPDGYALQLCTSHSTYDYGETLHGRRLR